MVLQTPHNPETEKLFKEVQDFIIEKGFGIMPPKKSILKIELADLCYMAIPPKLPFNNLLSQQNENKKLETE